jgi:hypothetical protein
MSEGKSGTQLVELSVDNSSARTSGTKGPEHRKLKYLHCVKSVARNRLMETVID